MINRTVTSVALLSLLAAQDPRGAARVTIESADGWMLVGSYAAPSAGKAFPAVLLLNGAARDRRAYIPLAQELSRRGIASLRLDLRGEGESTNLGRFEPGQSSELFANSHDDVVAAIRWLRGQPHVDGERLGVLGASYSAEAAARAARTGARAAAYVALSPGDFSDESARAIDPSGAPWWFIASHDERFAHATVREIVKTSRTAQATFVEGTSHASDILSPHYFLNGEIADWFAARLAGRSTPEIWGNLGAGPFAVGFRRHAIQGGTIVDAWYPTAVSGPAMRFEDYLRLSTDLRGASAGFPHQAGSLAQTLSTAISGDAAAIDAATLARILQSRMAAVRDAAPAAGRFPLVLWTPRYATTVAQSIASEYLASRGFVVAFARPESGARLPFELPTPEEKMTELRARVADMRSAVGYLESQPYVNAARIGVIAWSYTGEMALHLQLTEPRVTLVAGLSTNVLNDWVFGPKEALAALEASRLSVPYAVLTQRGAAAVTPPDLLNRIATPYFIEFPDLAHGSFNALEGFIPSKFGIQAVQRWSKSSEAGAAGYESIAVILLRLLRHHVAADSPRPVAPLPLTTSIAPGTVVVRRF